MNLVEQKENYIKQREELVKQREELIQKLRDIEISIERFNGAIVSVNESIKYQEQDKEDQKPAMEISK